MSQNTTTATAALSDATRRMRSYTAAAALALVATLVAWLTTGSPASFAGAAVPLVMASFAVKERAEVVRLRG